MERITPKCPLSPGVIGDPVTFQVLLSQCYFLNSKAIFLGRNCRSRGIFPTTCKHSLWNMERKPSFPMSLRYSNRVKKSRRLEHGIKRDPSKCPREDTRYSSRSSTLFVLPISGISCIASVGHLDVGISPRSITRVIERWTGTHSPRSSSSSGILVPPKAGNNTAGRARW